MVNFDLIIKRIEDFKGVSGDKYVAAVLGISPQDFSNRKKRGSLLPVIFEWAINESVNLDWLIKGDVLGAVSHLPQVIRLEADQRHGVLQRQLQRILDEGDKDKVDAVKATFKLCGAGKKKQGVDCAENEGAGTAHNRAA